jgi:hypothetical protein
MSRNGDEDDATLRFDDESNINNEGYKMRASTDAKLKDLMKRLEKLTVKKQQATKRLKPRGLKETLPQAKKKIPHMKRMSRRKRRKEETIVISLPITQYLLIMII